MKYFLIVIFIISNTVFAKGPHDNSGNRGHSNGLIIKCSSIKNHRKTCNADTSRGVKLIEQISRSSCHGNWGYTHNHIWVDNGCRAKFLLNVNSYSNSNDHDSGYSNSNEHNSGYSNNNEHKPGYSNNNEHNSGNSSNNDHSSGYSSDNAHSSSSNSHNNVSNRIICESINSQRELCSIPHDSQISMYRQMSRSSCQNNWGYSNTHIWVDHGCRAEFIVGGSH